MCASPFEPPADVLEAVREANRKAAGCSTTIVPDWVVIPGGQEEPVWPAE